MAGPKGTMPGKAEGWQPTVRYLLALVIVELLLYGVLRTYTRHGG